MNRRIAFTLDGLTNSLVDLNKIIVNHLEIIPRHSTGAAH